MSYATSGPATPHHLYMEMFLKTIDAKGLIACPGLVDVAARLREPGFEYKATLETEMHAAIRGGITTLACLPDTDPPLDEPGLVEMLKRRAASLEGVRVKPLGALTVGLKGEKLAEMAELTDAGCVGFFQGHSPMADTATLFQALGIPPGHEVRTTSGRPLAVFRDGKVIEELLR